jgi:hypothetical protein
MNIIHLKKSGLFTTWKKEFIPIDRPFAYYLHHYPKIDKDFTVEDLMTILKQNEADIDNLFQSYTRGFLLSPYFEEMQLPVLKEEKSKITKLIFSWSGEVDNVKEFGKPKYAISDCVHISGKVADEKQSYSMSFTHLNEIKNATFKLDKKIKFSHTDFGEKWDENRKTITKNFFKGIKSFTLQDVIGAFLNEISFHGYPEDVDKVADDLDKRLANSKNEKTYSMEEVFLKFSLKSYNAIKEKKLTKKNILRLEKLKKEIDYYEKVLKEREENQ